MLRWNCRLAPIIRMPAGRHNSLKMRRPAFLDVLRVDISWSRIGVNGVGHDARNVVVSLISGGPADCLRTAHY